MEKSKLHFCWVKVIDIPQKKKADDPSGASAPTKLDFVNLQPMAGGRPPGRYAGALMAGWWDVDVDYGGSTTRGPYHLDYMPMLGDRDEAITWLGSDEGETWSNGEKRVFLMCFTLTGTW